MSLMLSFIIYKMSILSSLSFSVREAVPQSVSISWANVFQATRGRKHGLTFLLKTVSSWENAHDFSKFSVWYCLLWLCNILYITVGCIIFLYILYSAGSIKRAIGKVLLVVSLVIPFLASWVCASRFASLRLFIFFGRRRNKAEGSSPASFIRRISLYAAAFTAFQVIHLHLHIIPNLSVMGCTERRWHPVTYCCWYIVLRHHQTATSGIWPWVSLSKATTVPVV